VVQAQIVKLTQFHSNPKAKVEVVLYLKGNSIVGRGGITQRYPETHKFNIDVVGSKVYVECHLFAPLLEVILLCAKKINI